LDRCPQVIVGTPGRLLDHIDRGTINLNSIKMVVLDEADEMMNMGFRNDIESILRSSPKQRQTITFSATMPRDILELVGKYQKNPQIVKIGLEASPASTVEQRYFEVRSDDKLDLLVSLLNKHNPYSSIVFCNTKHRVDNITRKLRSFGYDAEGLHGDISQPKRNRVMDGFRSGRIQILVATDVASRGIDVPNLDMIFNFEIPMDERSFVHRIGRTGRAGKTGIAFSLVSERDFNSFRQIKRYTKSNFIQEQVPALGQAQPSSNGEAASLQRPAQNKIAIKLKQVLQKNSFQEHIQTVESLVTAETPPVKIAAALIEILSQKHDDRPQNRTESRSSESRSGEGRGGEGRSSRSSSSDFGPRRYSSQRRYK
jgi:ATP-dependent RNA helicase DeaD